MNDLQQFQRLDKYARFIPELGRRETWEETVRTRVVPFFRDHKALPLTFDEWHMLEGGMLDLRAMPSMRTVQMAGPALERCEVGMYNCAVVALDSLWSFAELLYILMQGTGCSFSVEREFVERLPPVEPLCGWAGDYYIEDTTEGWCDALRTELVNSFNGIRTSYDFSAIRPAGARLHTKGGYASGPEPLRGLLMFARGIIEGAEGRRLTSVEVHRIACKIGDIVQVGGVRRAAMLSHSDLDDEAMATLKRGAFWETMPELSQANNSAVYEGPLDRETFRREWGGLRSGGTGERGIFRRDTRIADRRERARFFTNPCVTGDTWVTTTEGACQVKDLVSRPFTARLSEGDFACKTGFFLTGTKPVFQVNTDRGYQFKATADHRVMTTEGWKSVEDLRAGISVVLESHQNQEWGPRGDFDRGWTLGNFYGDGCLASEDMARLTYWGDEKWTMRDMATARLKSWLPTRSDVGAGTSEYGDKISLSSRELGLVVQRDGMYTTGEKRVPEPYEAESSSFISGFLSGWFDADGSLQGTAAKGYSVRLTSVDERGLRIAQRMLLRLGVKSHLYMTRNEAGLRSLPDGRGGRKDYECQAVHELVITGAEMIGFQQRVGFTYPSTKAQLAATIASYTRGPYYKPNTAKVVSIQELPAEPVYDCTVEEAHAFDGNGVRLHNCGELLLRNRQFCNLSIAVIRPDDDHLTIVQKVEMAAIWGTLQSACTDFRYIGPEWRANCEDERLLGIDLAGAADNRHLDDPGFLNYLKRWAIVINRHYAERLGIAPSVGVSVIKPGGNSSVFLGVGHPITGWVARHYIRRVESGVNTPMFAFLRDQGVPHAFRSPTVAVFEFPVAAPPGALITSDMGVVQQLDRWLHFKKHWTEHNPSVTIYVGDDEWDTARTWVETNWENVGGISFFPRDGGVYALAPIEPVTEERYGELIASLPCIDWNRYYDYETADSTTLGGDFACTSGACSI